METEWRDKKGKPGRIAFNERKICFCIDTFLSTTNVFICNGWRISGIKIDTKKQLLVDVIIELCKTSFIYDNLYRLFMCRALNFAENTDYMWLDLTQKRRGNQMSECQGKRRGKYEETGRQETRGDRHGATERHWKEKGKHRGQITPMNMNEEKRVRGLNFILVVYPSVVLSLKNDTWWKLWLLCRVSSLDSY